MSDEVVQSPVVVEVILSLSKNALGKDLENGEFEFELYNHQGTKIASAKNDKNGLIKFAQILFTSPGVYDYSIKEVSAPEGWTKDTKEYPVKINILGYGTGLMPNVSYPDGLPGFINTFNCDKCGLIKFPPVEFDAVGVYEYILKEETPSGGGWETDDKEIKVIVNVIDDGYGNLVATIEYPEGYPEFTNVYKVKPVSIIISACKHAKGAPLPDKKFEFGLYDSKGKLISKAKNGPAKEF